ncbi:MAG TPA: type VI secretion system contractile sheath large subunit [Xanthomonadales bacterium]|nr:type VI secretion system contractile sheath large subunit [Xanthomonadales bacterium]
MEFEFGIRKPESGRRIEHKPFRILLLGNFSGASDGGSVAERKIYPADTDHCDALWQLLEPGIDLGSPGIRFEPRDIDDFHPDSLFDSLPVFAQLRRTRKALLDPATAQETLDRLLGSTPTESEAPADQPEAPGSESSGEDANDMFQRLMGKPLQSPGKAQPVQHEANLDEFIHDLVAPHIVKSPDPRVDTAIDSVDLAISELMRNILHQPEFQALEASWRSLYGMFEHIEVDEDLQIFVCDISHSDLLAGLPEAGTGLDQSALFELLVKRNVAVDDPTWTLIVGDYTFANDPEDIAILTALGAAAAVNGGVFLGGACSGMLGCADAQSLIEPRNWTRPEAGSLWQSLRQSDFAEHIGLAMPRLLARLPYGEATDPTDRFDFEELPRPKHDELLWANPAFSVARLLAEGFKHNGWNMSPGNHVDLGPLPAYTFEHDGETRLHPCAEVLMPESTMVELLEQGFMPVVSYRDQNTAVIGRFQSIASPVRALKGPWET